MALMFPALAALYSCAEEYDYTPATFENGQQVYFEGAVNTNFVVNAVITPIIILDIKVVL